MDKKLVLTAVVVETVKKTYEIDVSKYNPMDIHILQEDTWIDSLLWIDTGDWEILESEVNMKLDVQDG